MRHAVLGCCAILFLSACATQPTGIRMDSANEHVVLSDAQLAQTLSFANANTEVKKDNIEGEVTVTSQVAIDQNIQYRFYWYDLQGLEVDNTNSPWRALLIRGHESVVIQDHPENIKAVNFRVSIKNTDTQ